MRKTVVRDVLVCRFSVETLSGLTKSLLEHARMFCQSMLTDIFSEAKPQQPQSGTFKRLEGPFGKNVFFEFRPFSQGKRYYVQAFLRQAY